MAKAVFLNSGGKESLLTACELHTKGYELHSLFIDAGYISREALMASARRIADRFCVSHQVITINSQVSLLSPNTNGVINLPTLGSILLNMGNMYAKALNVNMEEPIEYVATGQRYDGQKPGVFEKQMEVWSYSKMRTATPLFILAPASECHSDQAVLDKGFALGLTLDDFRETVSCQNAPTPCGTCLKCRQREEIGI